MKQCLNCQKETKNPKFCSKSCVAKYNIKNTIDNKSTDGYLCRRCKSKTIIKDTKSCEKCQYELNEEDEEIKEITLEAYRASNKLDLNNPNYYRKLRELTHKWNKHLKNLPCHNCYYEKHTELCHIISLSQSDGHLTLYKVNGPSNIVQLCPNCHWEYDNGILEIKINGKSYKNQSLPKNNYCPDCEQEINIKSKRCRSCAQKKVRGKHSRIPSKSELEQAFSDNKNLSSLGRQYKVSSNAVKKWLIKYELL